MVWGVNKTCGTVLKDRIVMKGENYWFRGRSERYLRYEPPIFIYLLSVCLYACLSVCTPHGMMPMESRRGCQRLWSWRYRQLWVTMYVSMQQQQVLLTTEPSLSPIILVLTVGGRDCHASRAGEKHSEEQNTNLMGFSIRGTEINKQLKVKFIL